MFALILAVPVAFAACFDIGWEPAIGPVESYSVMIDGRDAVNEDDLPEPFARVCLPWENEEYAIVVVARDAAGGSSPPSDPLVLLRDHDCDITGDGICGFPDFNLDWWGRCSDGVLEVVCPF